MKVAGIITEYNPFHNGHILHIENTKKLTGADYIVAVMSGSFVQRGEPALMDKYMRTEIALNCGVDLVIELPAPFSCASAEHFAGAGVSILNNLGVIDYLVFGSECGDIDLLNAAADLLAGEDVLFKEALANALRSGSPYPLAVSQAVKAVGNENAAEAIAMPNNLLGIEYIKALNKLGSKIKPLTYSRVGSYNSNELTESFASASAIRQAISEAVNNNEAVLSQTVINNMPDCACEIMNKHLNMDFPIFADDFTDQLFYKLLSKSSGSFTEYADISADIENRIKKALKNSYSFSTLADEAKTKAFTRARISRGLINILLNITEESLLACKASGYASYARILGFRRNAAPLLTEIKKHSKAPLISKLAGFEDILSPKDCSILRKEIYASNLYEAKASAKYKRKPQANEFTRGVVII